MFRALHHCTIPKDVVLDKCFCHLILIRPGYQETIGCILSVLLGNMHKNSELHLQENLEMPQDYSCFACVFMIQCLITAPDLEGNGPFREQNAVGHLTSGHDIQHDNGHS